MEEAIKTQYYLLMDRCVKMAWTHKIHEKQADVYHKKLQKNKTILAIAATVASTTSFITLIDDNLGNLCCQIIIAVASLVSCFFAIRFKDDSLESSASENKQYAAKCRALRDEYISFMTDVMSGQINTVEEIINIRTSLETKEKILFEGEIAPPTGSEASKRAKIALIDKRETKLERHEVEAILPSYLIIDLPD